MRIYVKQYIDLKPERKINIKIRKEKKTNYKLLVGIALVLSLIIHLPLLLAYEAHVINVTAKICHKSETRTIGYWKNHLEVAAPYLPIMLGDFEVDSTATAEGVFRNSNAKDMAVKLRAQLLAMKLNIKHFGIGDYSVENYGTDLYGLTAIADQLLIDDAPRQEMENIKDTLDSINNMHLLRVCLDKGMLPQTIVESPNGGEEWEIGTEQTISWTATNPEGDDNDLLINIWYCDNGGNDCFYSIEQGTENDGEYLWTVPSNQGLKTNDFDYKIKIVAVDSTNVLRAGYDKSNDNFAFLPQPEEPELEPELLTESIIETDTDSEDEAFQSPQLEADSSGAEESITETQTPSDEEAFKDKENKGKKDNPPGQEPADVPESIIETDTGSGGEAVETQSNE